MRRTRVPAIVVLALPLLAALPAASALAQAPAVDGKSFFGLKRSAVSLGAGLPGGGRSQLEYIEQGGDGAAPGGLQSRSLVVNSLWDFKLGSALTPYAGARLGQTRYRAAGLGGDAGPLDGSRSYALQLVVGVGFKLAPRLGLSLDYRQQRSFGAPGQSVAAPDLDLRSPTLAPPGGRLGVGLDWAF